MLDVGAGSHPASLCLRWQSPSLSPFACFVNEEAHPLAVVAEW